MTQGIIFNIQKYSIHDGPGIRTTVFLKGCPLECWWCHNPESQKVKQQFIFWHNKCIGCMDCEKVCPERAISFNKNGFYNDKSKCKFCEKCAEICPSGALELVGKKSSLDDVIKEVEKDRVFYEQSGGGVTFSGGEPLVQIDFLDSLLCASKQKGLHTAVDTSGYTSWGNIERIKDKVDLFLYDIKHMDDEKHKIYTGVSNQLILENLKKLALDGKKIWVRVPIIPSINDDDLNIQRTCEYISSLNLRDVFILPYHNIAVDKYKRLNMGYRISDIQVPKDELMKKIADIFKGYGFNVKIGG
ncbi:trans-4-hydroxy-L-proline dehydratase activase [Paramaledivibacter caminithermalis]|uniref:Pyruvate formate lyase activating enzyme n=1 Tax=Paramaledivibacter caminithermalis (strain DSM 15212 / CIP 107654 / DViRD3) TaxID=1121301 RepID=A0A1M6K779_PARC5|nr:trans-4-hydroxy-L-proline dehydratase activase [Paramaledivibacter caminithermalis]SHJ54838.1 pyruvate formate lyase activating enzyme [Paramaledivibacter caminithermalis DSM 15212]